MAKPHSHMRFAVSPLEYWGLFKCGAREASRQSQAVFNNEFPLLQSQVYDSSTYGIFADYHDHNTLPHPIINVRRQESNASQHWSVKFFHNIQTCPQTLAPNIMHLVSSFEQGRCSLLAFK